MGTTKTTTRISGALSAAAGTALVLGTFGGAPASADGAELNVDAGGPYECALADDDGFNCYVLASTTSTDDGFFRYSWDLDGDGAFNDSNQKGAFYVPETQAGAAGSYTISVQLNDGRGGTAVDTATVVVTDDGAATDEDPQISGAASPASLREGKKVTITIKLAGRVNQTRPTGVVVLVDGERNVEVPITNGRAQTTYKARGRGRHDVVAYYPGDSNFAEGFDEFRYKVTR